FPMPADHTIAALQEIVRFAVPGNPFDATGQIIGDPAYIRAGLEPPTVARTTNGHKPPCRLCDFAGFKVAHRLAIYPTHDARSER
ncbi:MAG: hypothetical protein ACEQSU_13125, partial [Microgenomates group bacterium]